MHDVLSLLTLLSYHTPQALTCANLCQCQQLAKRIALQLAHKDELLEYARQTEAKAQEHAQHASNVARELASRDVVHRSECEGLLQKHARNLAIKDEAHSSERAVLLRNHAHELTARDETHRSQLEALRRDLLRRDATHHKQLEALRQEHAKEKEALMRQLQGLRAEVQQKKDAVARAEAQTARVNDLLKRQGLQLADAQEEAKRQRASLEASRCSKVELEQSQAMNLHNMALQLHEQRWQLLQKDKDLEVLRRQEQRHTLELDKLRLQLQVVE